jgi:hypothetical protein
METPSTTSTPTSTELALTSTEGDATSTGLASISTVWRREVSARRGGKEIARIVDPGAYLPTLSLPLQGGDLGPSALTGDSAVLLAAAPGSPPSLSPRKGRKRGVERRCCQPWMPVPHLPTLSLPLQGGDSGSTASTGRAPSYSTKHPARPQVSPQKGKKKGRPEGGHPEERGTR